jgi:hypothetical protein
VVQAVLALTDEHSGPGPRGGRWINGLAQARVWEGEREQDLAGWNRVVAGAGAAGRPPPGSPGLPPHGPASWQGAWASDTSSAQRRSAGHPAHTSGTPPTPWPCPWPSAARNSRSRRSDIRRWPPNPPGMQRSEALGPEACSMPTHSHRQEWAGVDRFGGQLRMPQLRGDQLGNHSRTSLAQLLQAERLPTGLIPLRVGGCTGGQWCGHLQAGGGESMDGRCRPGFAGGGTPASRVQPRHRRARAVGRADGLFQQSGKAGNCPRRRCAPAAAGA